MHSGSFQQLKMIRFFVMAGLRRNCRFHWLHFESDSEVEFRFGDDGDGREKRPPGPLRVRAANAIHREIQAR